MAPRKPPVTLAAHTSARGSDTVASAPVAKPKPSVAPAEAIKTAAPKAAPFKAAAAKPAVVKAPEQKPVVTASAPASSAVVAPVMAAPDVVKTMEAAATAASAEASDLNNILRHLAEQGLEQTRKAYARLKVVSDEAPGTFEASRAAASSGLRQLNVAAIEAIKSNTNAAFDLVTALLGAKDVAEAVKVQAEHVRKQVEAVQSQAKDISALAQKVASESAEPIKATISKGFGSVH